MAPPADAPDPPRDAAMQRVIENRDWAAERTKKMLTWCYRDLVRELELCARLIELGRQYRKD